MTMPHVAKSRLVRMRPGETRTSTRTSTSIYIQLRLRVCFCFPEIGLDLVDVTYDLLLPSPLLI